MHKPILLKQLSLSFPQKCCFDDFSTKIHAGNRIAIIGRNGNGKSSLLNILRKHLNPSEGEVVIPKGLQIGYVEQTVTNYAHLSGGQRLNKRLSEALALNPDLLLLDEPTNHLDLDNRKSLIRMLQLYQGTLIIISHDIELLQKCSDIIWHIDNGKIHQFYGKYNDYIHEINQKRIEIERELSELKKEKNEMHTKLMQEQERAAKSKSKGQKSMNQRKWPTVVSKSKAVRAEQTSGKKKASIDKKKQTLSNQLLELRLPDIILPKFSLDSNDTSKKQILLINDGSIGYSENEFLLQNINLSIAPKEHIAIFGKNACGKSTLLKAILNQKIIIKTGEWYLPPAEHIGYLDQHYGNLNPDHSAIDHLHQARPDWNETEARRQLNDFLFRKNEEVCNPVSTFSGGEKARLSLSLISAKPPKLLILDEMTNNLDLETKEHVIQVLKHYPGSMIIVSHEIHFLKSIKIHTTYKIVNSRLEIS